MALSFSDIASKPLAEMERPPLPPVGTYRWSITKLPEVTTTQDDAWDILTINVRALEALDDVDTEDYQGDITNITQQVKFMFNKNDEVEFGKSEFRARQFFEKHVACAGPEDTMAQAMNACVNGQFLANIVWKQDKNDAELFHANIGRTAPLD